MQRVRGASEDAVISFGFRRPLKDVVRIFSTREPTESEKHEKHDGRDLPPINGHGGPTVTRAGYRRDGIYPPERDTHREAGFWYITRRSIYVDQCRL